MARLFGSLTGYFIRQSATNGCTLRLRVHRHVVAHRLHLIFCLFQSHLPRLLHRREVEESGVSVERIDEIGEASQRNGVILTIQIL